MNDLLNALKDRLDCANDSELARALGVLPSRICNYRKGRCFPDMALARRMARVLRLRPGLLIESIRGNRRAARIAA